MNPLRSATSLVPLARPCRLRQHPHFARARIKSPARQYPLTSPHAALFFHNGPLRQQTGPGRYGTAKQPPAHLRESEEDEEGAVETDTKPADKVAAEAPPKQEEQPPPKAAEPAPEQEVVEKEVERPAEEPKPVVLPSHDDCVRAEIPTISPDSSSPSIQNSASPSLDRVLDLQSPTMDHEDDKPPHLQAPRYVHNFDTWTLVQNLQKGGFKVDESTVMMKAVRGLLADNIELARRALVSKSNVENVRELLQRLMDADDFRKHICSKLLAQNSRQRSKTIASRKRINGDHSVHNYSMKWIS
jgi:Protein of unknown function (DUF1640)